MNDYRVLYVKEGDDGWWLEHCGGKWQLKQKEHKGKDLAWATVVGGCASKPAVLVFGGFLSAKARLGRMTRTSRLQWEAMRWPR